MTSAVEGGGFGRQCQRVLNTTRIEHCRCTRDEQQSLYPALGAVLTFAGEVVPLGSRALPGQWLDAVVLSA